MLRLYRDLIALRQQEPFYRQQRREHIQVRAIGDRAVALLLTGPAASDRSLLIAVNLGETASFDPDELAHGASGWELILDTEALAYGGTAAPPQPHGRINLVGPRGLVMRS